MPMTFFVRLLRLPPNPSLSSPPAGRTRRRNPFRSVRGIWEADRRRFYDFFFVLFFWDFLLPLLWRHTLVWKRVVRTAVPMNNNANRIGNGSSAPSSPLIAKKKNSYVITAITHTHTHIGNRKIMKENRIFPCVAFLHDGVCVCVYKCLWLMERNRIGNGPLVLSFLLITRRTKKW